MGGRMLAKMIGTSGTLRTFLRTCSKPTQDPAQLPLPIRILKSIKILVQLYSPIPSLDTSGKMGYAIEREGGQYLIRYWS
jgi:hypothetical protein